MPDPKFSKPWHGVPKDQINWHPTVLEEACIGCGTCVTGCSRLVYRFDFERKKPVRKNSAISIIRVWTAH